MPNNTTDAPVHVIKVTCSTSDQQTDFGVPVKEVVLTADADCFVNFNQPVTTTSRFLVKANVPVRIKARCSNVHYLGTAGTENLYIAAAR